MIISNKIQKFVSPLPHQACKIEAWHLNTNQICDPSIFYNLGILTWKLNPAIIENDPKLKLIRIVRKYDCADICEICKEKMPDLEEKLKIFFEEHKHEDEEVRYILSGSGYFDVRDNKDEWIRIHVKEGDMIIIPENLYHRFSLDDNKYIKAMRLFKQNPKWTPINRKK